MKIDITVSEMEVYQKRLNRMLENYFNGVRGGLYSDRLEEILDDFERILNKKIQEDKRIFFSINQKGDTDVKL